MQYKPQFGVTFYLFSGKQPTLQAYIKLENHCKVLTEDMLKLKQLLNGMCLHISCSAAMYNFLFR